MLSELCDLYSSLCSDITIPHVCIVTAISLLIQQTNLQLLCCERPHHSRHCCCCLTGVQNVQPEVQQLLKQYAAGNAIKVHKLRVFAVTQQSSLQNSKSRGVHLHLDADSSGAISYARQQQQQQLDAFARSASHSTVPAARPGQEQSRPTTATAADPTDNNQQQQAAQGTSVTAVTSTKIASAAAEAWKGCDAKQTQALHVWAELWVKGLPAKQLKQLAAAVAVGSATEKAAAAPGAYSSSSTVWWLISRRKDVASQLLQTGLAEVVPHEEFEWLGYRSAAIRAYSRYRTINNLLDPCAASWHAAPQCLNCSLLLVYPTSFMPNQAGH